MVADRTLEWLHDCCHLVLPRAWIGAGLLRDAAKRIVVAASRLLGATAACVILLSFAAEDRKSFGMAASRLRK